MEAFAYRIMQAGYSNPMFLSWGMLFAFAAVVVVLVEPKFRLGRASYFSILGLCILLFGGRYFIEGFFIDAVKGGYLFELALAAYSCLAVGAILLGISSAARSNDAYGHWKNWYLGFIPLVSLVLLFKSPMAPVKSGFLRLAGKVALVVLGLFLFGAGRMLVFATDDSSRQAVAQVENDREFQKKAEQYEIQNLGLAGFLKKAAGNTQYPQEIDGMTVLTFAEADGLTLRLVYKRDGINMPYSQAMLSQKTYDLCHLSRVAGLIEAGATIEDKYIGEQDLDLGTVRANRELCTQLQVND